MVQTLLSSPKILGVEGITHAKNPTKEHGAIGDK